MVTKMYTLYMYLLNLEDLFVIIIYFLEGPLDLCVVPLCIVLMSNIPYLCQTD